MIVNAAATIALAMLATMGWLTSRAYVEQRRLSMRLDGLGRQLASPTGTVVERSNLLDALKGERAPGFSLPGLDGERITLDALLASGKPLMLVFAEPRCGPCYEILPDLGGWQRLYGERLSIALVSSGEPEVNRAMTTPCGSTPVLRQQDLEVVTAYDLVQAPSAVLIQPDGRISAGPRYGTRAIRQLVADTLGMVLPPEPAADIQVIGVGDTLPSMRRPDLHGNVLDLATPHGTPFLMLFWSPGCSHCQELLPAILATEQLAHPPGMVLVSRGPIGLTDEVGFLSPVVFDDDRSLARTFGVGGTPSAVVIDGHGKIASLVFRGEPRVRALMEQIVSLVPQPAAHTMAATSRIDEYPIQGAFEQASVSPDRPIAAEMAND